MTKILYLHGLNSTLHPDRKAVLSKFSTNIAAPDTDYEGNPNVLQEYVKKYADAEVIVGSSAGGLLGYYLSSLLDIPALLFNPALPFRESIPNLPKIRSRKQLLQVVIGAQDDVVNPQKSFAILQADTVFNSSLEIHWKNSMGHPLPIHIFEEECFCFFNKLSTKNTV